MSTLPTPVSNRVTQKAPLNVSLLDPDTFIQQHGCLPVTSHALHEPSSLEFHRDGLFSEIIFGEIGGTERLIRFGYIDLKTSVFQPIILDNLLGLKSYYDDILAGRTYVTFDTKEKDFVRCSPDDPGADTGFTYFLAHYPKLQFKETGSRKRSDKIRILDKYKTRIFIDRYLVLPAGIRDLREEDGRLASEDINKLYLALFSMTQGMPDTDDPGKVYDALRYNIQMKVMEIYDYIYNLLTGKHGFGQGKFGSRNVAFGSRNVSTASPLTEALSPNDPKYHKPDEILLPLFQAAKNATPIVAHSLRMLYLDLIFTQGATSVTAIHPETHKLEYIDLPDDQRELFTTTQGIEKLIDLMRNAFLRHYPARVLDSKGKPYYLYMVYDQGDTVQTTRNVTEFKDYLEGVDHWTTAPLHEKLALLTTHGISKEECILVGSAALQCYGYPFVAEDIDVRVSDTVYARLKQSDLFTETERSLVSKEGSLEVYKETFTFQTFEELIRTSSYIEGYHVLALEACYTNYQQTNRPKDRLKLKWLRDHVYQPTCMRPLTWGELMYVATYHANKGKYATTTRYPILNDVGTILQRVHIASTEPSRTVTYKSPLSPIAITLPRYPVIDAPYSDALSPHPSTLAGHDGDFDGDVYSSITLWSDAATKECDAYYQKIKSMAPVNGGLVRGLADDALNKFTFHELSWTPRE